MKKPMKFNIDPKKLTKLENKTMSYLAKAWNSFCSLPFQHPSDIHEFQKAIHDAQKTVAIRAVRKTK